MTAPAPDPAPASELVPAGPAHAEALALVHAAAFPPAGRWTAAVMALQLSVPGAFGFLHPRGALVLARAAADEAEILTLATAPEARRRGLARLLLAAVLHEAARRGAESVVLEVDAGNAPARALYAAAGFEPVGRRRAYYADGADALILRAPLCGSAAGPTRPPPS